MIWMNVNIQKKIHPLNRLRLSLRRKKLIVNQILSSNLWYIALTNIIPNDLVKERKKNIRFPKDDKKIKASKHLVHPYIWMGGLGIFQGCSQTKREVMYSMGSPKLGLGKKQRMMFLFNICYHFIKFEIIFSWLVVNRL